MRNKKMIEELISKEGYVIGFWDSDIEKVSIKEMKKVLDLALDECSDIDVKIRGKLYVIEIHTIDNEKDFIMLSQSEYISRYGDERWYDEDEE